MKKTLILSLLLASVAVHAAQPRKQTMEAVDRALNVSQQHAMSLYETMKGLPGRLPFTVGDGKLVTQSSRSWTSGFFPGTLWYLHEYTNDPALREAAEAMTERIRKEQFNTTNHDVGFMINCSFGNGFRLTGSEDYRAVLIQAARSLATRFHPVTGTTRSWNNPRWMFPVIIDNMMNLELLGVASSLTGDNAFDRMARSHADRTIENHFRPDGSSYHVLDYDTLSGKVRERVTHQGHADESAWARGQAWGLYGFVMMYRQTGDRAYLDQAVRIGNFIMNHPRLPKDKIPYWDFDAPKIPRETRDASAGAIMASAFIELSTYVDGQLGERFLRLGEQQVVSLASPAYLAKPGTNAGFILRHSVGFMAKGREVDAPLSYADYYFVEAMMRLKRLAEERPLVDIIASFSENEDRARWLSAMDHVSRPVLRSMSRGELRKNMPVETVAGNSRNRHLVTHLEALGRLVTGIASWMELGPDNETPEGRLRALYIDWTVRALRHAVDPASPDLLQFDHDRQALVDAAFLAHGLLRARTQLWDRLDAPTRQRLIESLKRTRTIKPIENNWLLFTSIVESALKELADDWNLESVRYAVDRHAEWYKGDAWYGDGPEFHLDYYNSFVIQPMLTTTLEVMEKHGVGDPKLLEKQRKRYTRYAEQQERMISPEGSYPVVGRSLAYRFGAFYALSDVSFRGMLPKSVVPAQVRCALTTVITRQLAPAGTFSEFGFLQLGLWGHQPGVAESYISTGSLYLCSGAFMALGLPVTDPFWSSPAADWTSLKAWKGIDIQADKALRGM